MQVRHPPIPSVLMSRRGISRDKIWCVTRGKSKPFRLHVEMWRQANAADRSLDTMYPVIQVHVSQAHASWV